MRRTALRLVRDSGCRLLLWPMGLAIALIGSTVSAGAQAPSPLGLGAVLDSVTVRYPVVLAAQARVRAAQGSRVSAGAFGNPIVGYQVDDNVDITSFAGGTPVRGLEREALTTVTLPLEPLYQRGPRVRGANAEVRAVTDDAVAAGQRAALDATKAFYRTALAQVSVATSRDLLAWLDSLVAYNRSRVQQGVAAQADLIRVELERDRAAADATLEDAELAQARADLSTFVGVSPSDAQLITVAVDDRPFVLPREPASPDPSRPGGAALADQVGAGRAEVRAARERVAVSAASISSERTLILRQLGVTLGAKQTEGRTSLIAGLSLPIPLFDANRGEIARATAERAAATYELDAQERSVRAEISGAYEAARLLTERTTAMTSTTEAFLVKADEARRIALGAYREGAVPLFQVIDAARARNDALLAYYRTLYAQHQAVASLLFAEGDDLRTTLPALIAPDSQNR